MSVIAHQNVPNCTLFVGDLAVFADEESLREIFSPYGEILEINIKTGNGDRRVKLGYGHIRFSTPEAAVAAKEGLHGVLHKGRALRLQWAGTRGHKNPVAAPIPSSSQVLVSFISRKADYLVSEESLRSVFSRFGNVVDATIKKTSIDPDTLFQGGYGFVHFEDNERGIESAMKVINIMAQNYEIDSVAYQCQMSDTLRRKINGEPPRPSGPKDVSGDAARNKFKQQQYAMGSQRLKEQIPRSILEENAAHSAMTQRGKLTLGSAAGGAEYQHAGYYNQHYYSPNAPNGTLTATAAPFQPGGGYSGNNQYSAMVHNRGCYASESSGGTYPAEVFHRRDPYYRDSPMNSHHNYPNGFHPHSANADYTMRNYPTRDGPHHMMYDPPHLDPYSDEYLPNSGLYRDEHPKYPNRNGGSAPELPGRRARFDQRGAMSEPYNPSHHDNMHQSYGAHSDYYNELPGRSQRFQNLPFADQRRHDHYHQSMPPREYNSLSDPVESSYYHPRQQLPSAMQPGNLPVDNAYKIISPPESDNAIPHLTVHLSEEPRSIRSDKAEDALLGVKGSQFNNFSSEHEDPMASIFEPQCPPPPPPGLMGTSTGSSDAGNGTNSAREDKAMLESLLSFSINEQPPSGNWLSGKNASNQVTSTASDDLSSILFSKSDAGVLGTDSVSSTSGGANLQNEMLVSGPVGDLCSLNPPAEDTSERQ